MSALTSENQQWLKDGDPIVNGKIYIGDQGADPILNPKNIFSDRDLTVPLSQPVLIDSEGFPATKIWLDGRYSLLVTDSADVTLIQELDNGVVSTAAVVEALTSVAGSDTITASANPTITSYEDNQLYTFRAVATNTTAVTLNIDSVGAKSIFQDYDQEIEAGQIPVDEDVIVMYNATQDYFAWINPNRQIEYNKESADIVAASTTNLANLTGNTVTITGSTTITGFGTIPAGMVVNIIFAGAPSITHNGTTNIMPGAEDQQMEAGDRAILVSHGSGNNEILMMEKAGSTIIAQCYDGLATVDVRTDVAFFAIPWTKKLVAVQADVKTAGTTGVSTIDIHKNGTTVLSTKITIDSTETSSSTAATPPVISVPTVAKDDIYTIDVDGVSTTEPLGLTVRMIFK